MWKVITCFLFPLLILGLQSNNDLFANGEAYHHKHADTTAKRHHWEAPPQAAKRINPILKTPESVQRGKSLYSNYCVNCHGNGAKGDGPAAEHMNPKPSDLTAMAGLHSDGDFAWKISNGRGPMPGWKDSLKENQIWDIVNFIQSLGQNHTGQQNHKQHSQ